MRAPAAGLESPWLDDVPLVLPGGPDGPALSEVAHIVDAGGPWAPKGRPWLQPWVAPSREVGALKASTGCLRSLERFP